MSEHTGGISRRVVGGVVGVEDVGGESGAVFGVAVEEEGGVVELLRVGGAVFLDEVRVVVGVDDFVPVLDVVLIGVVFEEFPVLECDVGGDVVGVVAFGGKGSPDADGFVACGRDVAVHGIDKVVVHFGEGAVICKLSAQLMPLIWQNEWRNYR